MKTIEERAREAGIVSQYKSDYRYDKKSVESGYMQGATEQKVIDDAERVNQALMENGSINTYKQGFHAAVENACKWLEENLPYIMCKINAPGYWLGKSDFIETFRKVMEE